MLIGMAVISTLIGCSKSQPPAASNASPPVAVATSQAPPMTGMPMMKEDPRSIQSVEGTIREVSPNEIVVYTLKRVTLKFAVDSGTVIQPKQALIPGMCVTIDIQQLPYGMKAKKIKIHTASDANHCA